MRNFVIVLSFVLLMMVTLTVNAAVIDVEFNQEKYDQALDHVKATYELATKGFVGFLQNDKLGLIHHEMIGLTREEVEARMGKSDYSCNNAVVYKTRDLSFPRVCFRFNAEQKVQFITFPVQVASIRRINELTIQQLFGSATHQGFKMTYFNQDQSKVITFNWDPLYEYFSGVTFGTTPDYDDKRLSCLHNGSLRLCVGRR